MRLSDEFRNGLDIAARAYAETLFIPGSQAQSYLLGRGIAPEVADAYRLGEVDGTIPEHASYKGWISIPYLTKLGGVVSLKFRRLSGDGSKYITPYPTRIYNTLALDRAEQLGYVAITEGEIDCITLDGLCDIPAIGIPGVEVYKAHPECKEMLRGFNRVLVFADPDEPGQRLGMQILRDLDTAHLVALPGDVNEAYLSQGREFIREAAGL
jgi:DNA primase